MIPVLTPEEMAAVDAAAPDPVDVLIERAGAAVALAARRVLGGTYGRRVVVIAGKGNNGADGRAAARRLLAWGVRCEIVDAADGPGRLGACDLVIDAAYGTGFHGEYTPPVVDDVLVLAVDIPSGVDGLTGATGGAPLSAAATVTFAALKPGLLLGAGPDLAGRVEVADIGLDVCGASAWLMADADAASGLARRRPDGHKWSWSVLVVGGSAGLEGAATLSALGSQGVGVGLTAVASPGVDNFAGKPVDVVGIPLPAEGWAEEVVARAERFGALVVGPGIGLDEQTQDQVRRVVAAATVPVVIDSDALTALGRAAPEVVAARSAATVLTPHDAEFERLFGARPSPDRLGVVRDAAGRLGGAALLLKGPATLVGCGDEARVVTSGDERLATGGTGDVLSGMIGAQLAAGSPAMDAAAVAAHVHGVAARAAGAHVVTATDVAAELPSTVDSLLPPR